MKNSTIFQRWECPISIMSLSGRAFSFNLKNVCETDDKFSQELSKIVISLVLSIWIYI